MHKLFISVVITLTILLIQVNCLYSKTPITMDNSKDSAHWITNTNLSIEDFLTTKNYIDNNKDTIKQETVGLFIKPSLIDKENTVYIKGKKTTPGLNGELRNNKPYSGFFINPKAFRNLWAMVDFYKEGILQYQLYSDFFESCKLDEINNDTELFTRTLSHKNTFNNGLLIDGVELPFKPYELKDVQIQIARYVKNGHTDYFDIGFFGVGYAEFMKIESKENGYILSSTATNKAEITYTEDGRKMEIFDKKDQLICKMDCKHYNLEDEDSLKEDGIYYYFIDNGKVYIESFSIEETPAAGDSIKTSDALLNMIGSFYFTFREITLDDVAFFSQHFSWNQDQFLGRYFINKGKRQGTHIEKGKSEDLYNLYLTKEDNKTELILQNKKLDEIVNWTQKK